MRPISNVKPGDYAVSLPRPDDCVSEVTNKHNGGKFIITSPICMYEFGYSFPLQGFVTEVFRYYNPSSTQLHLNGWTILSALNKFLRMLDKESTVRIFRQCHTLISSVERVPFFPCFFNFANSPKGLMRETFKWNSSRSKSWRGKWVVVSYHGTMKPQDRYSATSGCTHYWRAPPSSVNDKPFLNTKEEKVCAGLDTLRI